jgi:hypothetical protein
MNFESNDLRRGFPVSKQPNPQKGQPLYSPHIEAERQTNRANCTIERERLPHPDQGDIIVLFVSLRRVLLVSDVLADLVRLRVDGFVRFAQVMFADERRDVREIRVERLVEAVRAGEAPRLADDHAPAEDAVD